MSRLGLTSRLTLAMAGVVVLAIALSALLTGPLLRSATEDAERAALTRQATLLARLPVTVLARPGAGRLAAGSDLSLGVVGTDGRPQGVATVLTPAQLADVTAGRPVSATARVAGHRVLVVAEPARGGGAVVLTSDDRTVTTALAHQRRRVLLSLLLGLLAATLVAALAARRITQPLARLATAARRLAAGERGVVPPASGGPEVSDVGAALVHLDDALQTSEDRQRRFLLSVSHELRTPLTTLRGYADALADGVVPADEIGSVGETMRGEALRLERYVTDLLTLGRLDAQDFPVTVDEVDLSRLVGDAATAWARRGADVGVSVVEASRPPAVVLRTDGGRVRQVLDALVDNAVRVCPSGSRVVLAVTASGSGARLEVRDSGPGLTDGDASVAFEPGVLHERYADRGAGGYGLGLAIVHGLVQRLGGTVTVGRAAEGGAAFVIDLPDLTER